MSGKFRLIGGRFGRLPSKEAGQLGRLTIIPWFTKGPTAHHAFWPVSQGHTAAQGGGSIEIRGRLTWGTDAVGTWYPWGATRNWGNYSKREMFQKTVIGIKKPLCCREIYTHTHKVHFGMAPLYWWLSERQHNSTTVKDINTAWLEPLLLPSPAYFLKSKWEHI